MLEIMRDPHIGVMGALSLISVILLKIGLLSSFGPMVKPAVLILMCILSRWSAVLQIYLFPYARKEGKAKLFIQGINFKIFTLTAIITVICVALVLSRAGLITLLITSCFAYIAARIVNNKMGGVTGDTLGAGIELTEVVTLLIVCVSQGVING
jgi:adenosylcobinamide-GDP ribazoletransferase